MESIQLASLGECSSSPGHSTKNPETGLTHMCRLAVRLVLPGGSSYGTQKQSQNDESLGRCSSPARQFLENSRSTQNTRNKQSICTQFNIHFMQLTTRSKNAGSSW